MAGRNVRGRPVKTEGEPDNVHMTTKQKIYMTAMELAEKRDIERVTVKDIIEACGVSRQTFYYYYRDLDDLFETVAEEINERMLEKIRSGMPLEDWLKVFLELLLEKKKLYLRVLYSRMGVKALSGMQNAICRWLIEYTKQNNREIAEHRSAQEILLLMDFYAGGIFNLMRKLLEEDYIDMEKLVPFVASVICGHSHL